jgi:hypothetical protein
MRTVLAKTIETCSPYQPGEEIIRRNIAVGKFDSMDVTNSPISRDKIEEQSLSYSPTDSHEV